MSRTRYSSVLWLICGALLGALGVVGAALAAHLPQDMFALPQGRAMLDRAVEMTQYHGLGLLAVGILQKISPRGGALSLVGGGFLAGWACFCSGVLGLAFANIHLPYVAPTGGVLLIGSWILMAVCCARLGEARS